MLSKFLLLASNKISNTKAVLFQKPKEVPIDQPSEAEDLDKKPESVIVESASSNENQSPEPKKYRNVFVEIFFFLKEAPAILKSFFSKSLDDCKIFRGKLTNLMETNYRQGIWHIEKNNIGDAIFRFRFIKKFWPQHLDSHYQLALCLTKKNKYREAKEVLKNLLTISPDYANFPAKELMDKIDSPKKNPDLEVENR
jgi:hypothetical protein